MSSFPTLEAAAEERPRCFYDASLLFRQMALNQVAQTEVAENGPLLFRQLQALSTLCRSKEERVLDLVSEVDDDSSDGWHGYCPNAAALDALRMKKSCGLAAPTTKANQKRYLERRSGEFPFAPRQYVYAASKSGVVPQFGDAPQGRI